MYAAVQINRATSHFSCTCYHPLFVFNQFGDLERCALRPGNVHSAEGWRDVLEPVVARYRTTMKRRYFRADAAFASPEIYEFLEAEGYAYVIRLPANAVLQRRIAHARYTVFQMAEVAVPRDLFRRILAMIDELRPKRIEPC